MRYIKLLHQCGKCGHLFYTDECIYCRDEYIRIIDRESEDICNYFGFPYQKFRNFFYKYFGDISDYKSLYRVATDGIYCKVIASIFYYFANLKREFSIKKTSVCGYVQKKNYYHNDIYEYLKFTKKLMADKYTLYYPNKLTRIEKITNAVKKILGRMRKPVLINHVCDFIPLIGYDRTNIKSDTIASMYIMFYYKYVRGWDIDIRELAKAADIHYGTISRLYYTEFKKFAEKRINEDFEESQFNDVLYETI